MINYPYIVDPEQPLVIKANWQKFTDPESNDTIVTARWVNEQLSGLPEPKSAVVTASFTELTLSGLYDVSGYTLQNGDRVLDASVSVQGGVYIASAGAWSRASDFSLGTDVGRVTVPVLYGNYSGNIYLNTVDPCFVGTDSPVFQIYLNTTYTAGYGLNLNEREFSFEYTISETTTANSVVKRTSDGSIYSTYMFFDNALTSFRSFSGWDVYSNFQNTSTNPAAGIRQLYVVGSQTGNFVFNAQGFFNFDKPISFSGLSTNGVLTNNNFGEVSSSALLPLNLGGTNASLTASNGGIVYSDNDSLDILSGTSTANKILLSGATSAPTWSTSTFSDTYAENSLLYSNGANNVQGLTTGNNGVLITSETGIPSISSILPSEVQSNITSLGTIGSPVTIRQPSDSILTGLTLNNPDVGGLRLLFLSGPGGADINVPGSPGVVSFGLSGPTSGYSFSGTFTLASFTASGVVTNNSSGVLSSLSSLSTPLGGTGQTTYTNGQLLIGNNTGNTLSKSTITPGTGVSVFNGLGSITLSIGQSVGITSTPTFAGINITTGVNARAGSGTLAAGNATITTTAVSASSLIFVQKKSIGSAANTVLRIGVITAGVSFTVVSSSGTDTSSFNWLIIN